MRLFLVEDEPIALRRLQHLLQIISPADEIAGTAGSVKTAVNWLQQNPAPDLALMDIELTDGQSFDIFQKVPVPCPVIFITAYDSYAIQAFKVNSIDYILKPFDEDDLTKSLNKLRTMRHLLSPGTEQALKVSAIAKEIRQQLQVEKYKDRFLVKSGHRFKTITAEEISFFRAEGKVVYLHLEGGPAFIIDYSLEELENMLHPSHFFRASRQYIIAHKSVCSIHAGYNGRLNLYLDTEGKQEVIVSREKAQALKTWLGE